MSESIVQKEPVQTSQVNPFARAQSEHVNAGAVAIESERAIAEAQGKLVIAKRFPRDQARAYANIVESCKRQGLAEEACYSFPRGGQNISGPSIRLAEMLAANWGNIDYGIRELSRKEGVSEMEAYAWDLETNVVSSQKFTVRHIRDTRGGGVALKDERDIYELTANMGGRRLRARILAIIPADIVQTAVDECGKTLAGNNDVPLADRVRNMVSAFKTLGVTPAMIEKRLTHPLESVSPEELGDLRKIHNSLRDGISKWGDWFGDAAEGNPDLEAAPARPAPPERAKKGAAAVKAVEANVAPVPAAVPEPIKAVDVQAQVPVVESPAFAAAEAVAPVADKALREAGAVGGPRAFLKPDEVLTADIVVEAIETRKVDLPDRAGVPTVKARVSGEFVGEVYEFDGAGDDLVAKKPWVVGAKLRLSLKGRNGRAGVRAIVEAVAEVEDFG